MSLAVAEAYRVLRQGGLLLDVHPTDEPATLEVWHAQYATATAQLPANLESIHCVALGRLDYDPATRRDYTATTDVLANTLDDNKGFRLDRAAVFDYQYFFDSLDELTNYLEDNVEFARASNDLLERALYAIQHATTTPKIVIIQKTSLTTLRKIG